MARKKSADDQLFYIEANDPIEYSSPKYQPQFAPSSVHFHKARQEYAHEQTSGRARHKAAATTEHSRIRNKLERLTFGDISMGLKKEVTIFVDPFKLTDGRTSSKCEKLFGIVPGRFGLNGDDDDDDRIMVIGLVPNQVASDAGVKTGTQSISTVFNIVSSR